MGGGWKIRGIVALLGAVIVIAATIPTLSYAQTPPPPPFETPAIPAGLGDCAEGVKVAVLNDAFNALPEDQSKRNGNGGFETFIVLNCRAFEIHWEVLDENGRVVPGGSGTYEIYNEIDEVEWIDLQTIVFEKHPVDVLDADGNIIYYEGDTVVDDDGNAVPANEQLEPVTAYRFKYEFANDALGVDGKRPLSNNRDYQLKFEVIPYPGASDNHIFNWVFEIVAKLSGNWWQKIIRVLSPISWLDEGITYVARGIGSTVMGGMCVTMGNFMTTHERQAFVMYDSTGDGVLDSEVEGASDPNKPNANGNCKLPAKTPEEELEDLRVANYREANERRALVGLPPIYVKPAKRDTYLFEVLDGADPRDRNRPFGERVAFEISHLTLAPRLAANTVSAAPLQGVHGGITTFTGLLTGTPSQLTYERGIVRIGWSVLFNVTFVVIALVIVWIGFTQVLRVFMGGNRSLADWRETVPRLLLAVLGALLSYWFCSLCIDIADGISRYIAAAMRVTPADITLTLGQALTAIFLKNVSHAWLAAIPVVGQILAGLKIATIGFLVILMKLFAISVLLVVAQFVMRIGILNLMIVTSPLGMLMWALPETSGWGRRWVSLFMTTLFQHGLQIVCFAIALWFIRLATPIGIIADTGLVSGDLQAVLPTQMAFSLILGTILMIVTFKIPSMLGQGGLQESFVSTLSMAALGFRALGSIAGGGGTGPLGFLGIGGNQGGSAASAALGSGDSTKGVATGVTAAASNMAAGAAVGTFRALKTGFSMMRGAESYISPEVGGDGGGAGGGGGEGGEGEDGGTGASGGEPTGGGPPPSPISGAPGEEVEGDDRGRLEQRLGSDYVEGGQERGTRAMSDWYMNDGGNVRTTNADERSAIRDMGVGRFNSAMRGDSDGGQPRVAAQSAAESAETGGRPPIKGPHVDDKTRVTQELGGDEGLRTAQGNNVRAVNENFVNENGSIRRPNEGERSAIRTLGPDRFNDVMRSGAEQSPDITARQSYFDDRRARNALGPEGYDRAAGQLMNVGGPYMVDAGQTRIATPAEKKLLDHMGQERFNNVFSRDAEGADEPGGDGGRPGDGADDQSGGQGYQEEEETGRFSDARQQIGQSFTAGYRGHMDSARVPLISDARGRLMPETSEGLIAKRTLGEEEYQATADRQISYVGSGAWANVGGQRRPLSAEQSYARRMMGDQEFSRSMDRTIHSEGKRDGEGRSLVSDNGEERPATRAEQRLMSDDGLGESRFNRVMGERSQFMGEGNFVRDNNTVRLASQNESKLLDQVKEGRFNDVMGRRFADGGTGYKVDTMPSRQEVFRQVTEDTGRAVRGAREQGGEAIERGREVIQDTGFRGTGGLGDVGESVGEEVRGDRRPASYDAARGRRAERSQRESPNPQFYGMRTDME